MKTRITHLQMLALALVLIGATLTAGQAGTGRTVPPPRPQGSCDIYAAAGNPCVAAHSTTRALYAAYSGPLYQVLRQSDGRTMDIAVVQPVAAPSPDAGGYANAAAQDAFCANTYCWIVKIYDQSPKHNDLTQAPRGGFSGPAMGGFNNVPIADMAPVTVMGHKVYGVFIAPGMGLRDDDPVGTAVDDQAEGQYWVINGLHYNNGCCFDYGNAEIDSRDDGNGTMETTYYGNATGWYHGPPPGPWIMTDQENNLVGCVNPGSPSKLCDLPSITWRFVTATADGEPHHWRSMGGDAQTGDLKVMFDGPRVNASYDPMRKQGAILLGNGGDNSVGSQGTFYEGAMTAPNTFPTLETNQKVQANVVAAKYDVARVTVTAPNATATPSGLQTFSPGSSQDTTVTFTNTTGAPASGVELSLSLPKGWTAVVAGTNRTSATIAEPVPPGASVTATFKVTSSSAAFNGDLVGNAKWTNSPGGVKQSDTAVEKVRNVSPITINEFRVSGGVANNTTNSFIELYNGSTGSVDISNWTLTTHATQQAIFSTIRIPAGTRLAAHGFYLLGLSNSGLAAPARKSDSVIHVRSTAGMSVGETIEIGTGPAAEMRKIMAIGTAAANNTTLWQPLPDGPVITIPAGATNVPVTSVAGVEVGQKIALGYGATYPAVAMATGKYEIVTVTAVGKQGTQAWLSADGKAGDTNIKVSSVANVSVGDKIRLDIDSVEHGIETVTVTRVGTQSARNSFNGPLRDTELGTGLDLAEPLKFNHRANLPFSNRGTGISFTPATAFAHSSNEPVQAVGTGITLDKPLVNDHAIDAVVRDASVTAAGYQGTAAPNQWFGGPALANAGAMVLRDAAGLVVDSLNYGLLVDPWAAEGYHGVSGAGQAGCRVTAPGTGRGGGQGAQGGIVPDRSAGRFPDGRDTDSNCNDFLLQSATVIAVDSGAGATNIKVAGVSDFSAGQPILIDAGTNQETATIATVGTAGATTVAVAATAGATVISIAGPSGFVNGQSIHIDTGANAETAVVVSTAGGGRGGGAPATPTVTVAAPLKMAHAVGAQVAGTGITLTSPLSKAHANGARVASAVPTPGAPNQYLRKPGNPTPVPNWPREAERPDAPKPQPAARWLVAQVGEYQGPSRPDGTAPRLYLLEENGRPMYIVDRGEARPAAITVLEGTPERASAITIDGVRYERQQVGPEGSGQLRVESIRPVADVLKESMTSPPPTETGDFLRADLVELVALDPTVHLDIRYATTNNFLGSVFYAQARAFLQRPAADSLLRVQQQLRPLGYGLLVHDGYRPWFVTRTFWECTPEDKKWLVANPASGSKHNRGAAVDLTLYDLATGAVIDMPSTYDESTPRAYAFYPGGTSLQRWHRALLRRLMEAEGFTVNPDEWWHFDYKDWRRYALGNVAFEHIK